MTIEFLLLCATAALSLFGFVFALLSLLRVNGLARDRSPELIEAGLAEMRRNQEHFERGIAEDLALARREGGESARHMREEMTAQLKAVSEANTQSLKTYGDATHAQSRQLLDIQRVQHEDFAKRLADVSVLQAAAAKELRETLEQQMTMLRGENTQKLEQMRTTVDEKLQGTLEQRLGESFKHVSERLEAVHKGLGEMQTLATGVGDLKRVLTNVKARGSWGEVQLGALLEQILTPSQYRQNAVTADSGADRVEYAIVMPGQGDGREVLLPLDCKFPIEDYERLQAAAEAGDAPAVEAASKALELRLKNSARDISTKYVHPPRTTDFAIMFLPTEGLFAEALRRPGLADELQRSYRVMIAGPTTLAAFLSSLRMGFRTLAIQERSGEVWQVLGAVKSEFGKFGEVLSSVKKKLQEASNHIDRAETRNRVIERKLRSVEELPAADAARLIGSVVEDQLGLAPEEEGTIITSHYFDEEEMAAR